MQLCRGRDSARYQVGGCHSQARQVVESGRQGSIRQAEGSVRQAGNLLSSGKGAAASKHRAASGLGLFEAGWEVGI